MLDFFLKIMMMMMILISINMISLQKMLKNHYDFLAKTGITFLALQTLKFGFINFGKVVEN